MNAIRRLLFSIFILMDVVSADPTVLKLNDGSVLKGEVSPASPTATEVLVSTEFGVIRVPVDKITPESRKAVGIGQPATTAQYEARIAQLEAENAELRLAVTDAKVKSSSIVRALKQGSDAWKKGSDRAGCVLNIRNVQQSIRAYQNMNNIKDGNPIPWDQIFGNDKFMAKPTCPAGGTYTFLINMPKTGSLACKCSHSDHIPENYTDW